MRGRARRLASAGGLGLVLALAAAAGAEVRVVEAVGAVPLDPAAPLEKPPRDVALGKALAEAVWRVALDELTDFDPTLGEADLTAALGAEPLDYATRFRILEDRGERPALFTEEPGVETEYVMMVQVHVDAQRVRERLARAGLLVVPSGESRRHRVWLVMEEVGSYAAYQAVRTLLEELGVRSALPVEMEAGRAVLVVDGDRRPEALMADLLRVAPPNLSLVPLGSDSESLRLRARFLGGPPAAGAWPEADEIDSPDPNRY